MGLARWNINDSTRSLALMGRLAIRLSPRAGEEANGSLREKIFNEPKYLPRIAQTLAELRGVSLEEIARVTTANALSAPARGERHHQLYAAAVRLYTGGGGDPVLAGEKCFVSNALQVFGREPGLFCNACQHSRADFIAGVKGKNIIRPVMAR